ncbi:MAG: DNA translocase FtsK 4TM domain-containing protein, partial [Duncaniella sp.]|nr:DNA translocase FtsK 4TM domain-containing protein [Duncaniella sp.]
MPSQYSPIDESSYTDTAFDPEAMLNGVSSQYTSAPTANQAGLAEEPINTNAGYQGNPASGVRPEPAPAPASSAPKSSHRRRKKSPSAFARTLRLIGDSRTVMFLGIVFIIAAGYSLIVAMSYFSHIGNDQSALLNGDFDPDMIKNAGGPLGAWLAHTLIYKWLGIGSFILIYYLAMCGLSMLKVYRPPFWSLTLRCLLTAVALSVICGFATYELSSPIYWGGQHGHLLNEKLMIFTGFWGALGLSLIMGGLVVIL